LLLLAPRPSSAQSAGASLEVTVESDHEPGAPARVRLSAPGFARETTTDATSRALFLDLAPGDYVLEADGTAGACAARPVTIAPHAFARVTCRAVAANAAPETATTPPRSSSEDRRTFYDAEALAAVPRPTDPWSVLRDVPAVLVDRVNVGGSETAQQSLLVSYGDPGSGASWSLDGVDITDPAALGTTAVHPDMASLLGREARTGAFDVHVRTPGAQVGLYLRAPRPGLAGRAHLRGSTDALQSENLPASLEGRPFYRNETEHVLEVGAEAGGPMGGDRFWLWGSANRNALQQQTFTLHEETLSTTAFQVKGRGRLGSGTLSLLALRAEKVDDDRDTTFSSAPEARWRQSG